MSDKELDLWWSHLTVKEQERVASKLMSEEIKYPATTRMWLALKQEKKEWVYNHCSKKHGVVTPDWQEGYSMSY